jgi:hypothetical protein
MMKAVWLGAGEVFAACILLGGLAGSASPALADTIRLKSGATVNGVIEKMEAGRVSVKVGQEAQTIPLTAIEGIDFDTPHLTEGTDKQPVGHFEKDFDPQEMTRLGRDLSKSKAEVRKELDQIKATWQANQPVEKDKTKRWESTKETFGASMKSYQGVLNELYLHVLAEVEDYNRVAKEAETVYIGVKGIFNVGSPLVSADLSEAAPKRFVPKSWYDRISYEGYSRGYREGSDFERLNRIPQTCPGDSR